jgi:hypothetical protein
MQLQQHQDVLWGPAAAKCNIQTTPTSIPACPSRSSDILGYDPADLFLQRGTLLLEALEPLRRLATAAAREQQQQQQQQCTGSLQWLMNCSDGG